MRQQRPVAWETCACSSSIATHIPELAVAVHLAVSLRERYHAISENFLINLLQFDLRDNAGVKIRTFLLTDFLFIAA